ncbi:hypothetical protein D3C72_1154280 [compost metagenome]
MWIPTLIGPTFPSNADPLLRTDAQNHRRARWNTGGSSVSENVGPRVDGRTDAARCAGHQCALADAGGCV